MIIHNCWKTMGAIFVLCVATVVAAYAQTFNALTSFDGANGAFPFSSLVQGVDGDFYGTTNAGGISVTECAQGCGTVFRVTPSGRVTTLYSFCAQSNCPDGQNPSASLVLASDGNFYGTTPVGGTKNGGGTVFRITRGGVLTTLHNFGTSDGYSPSGGLVEGSDGNLYGATALGGNRYADAGTVYKISLAGSLTTLYTFSGSDGKRPAGALIQGSDGNFYGTTEQGGTNNDGEVFKITPKGTLTVVYSFCSLANCLDGIQPTAAVVQGTDGNFYGTTAPGAGLQCTGSECGTIFKLTPQGVLTTLYTFCQLPGCSDGYTPYAGLAEATDGNLYGVTAQGGHGGPVCVGGCGTVFEVTPDGALTTIYSLCSEFIVLDKRGNCADGAGPEGGLLQATSGAFYGTPTAGGPYGEGMIFSLDTGLGPFVALVGGFGKVGQTGGILGQGFTGTTNVSLNGTPASYTVVSDTFIKAAVPPGATTGYVTVTTPSGTLTSNVPFRVIP